MQRLTEFVANHPILWSLAGAILLALLATELFRLLRGQRPIPPGEAVRLINSSDAVVVDVRSAADYRKGHILNAVHVPLAGIDQRAKEIAKDHDRTVICYCAMGSAALQACAKLRKLGYHDVHALKGGLNAWQGAGLPVTTK
jgi:rhodanese-related sulfurtransferase